MMRTSYPVLASLLRDVYRDDSVDLTVAPGDEMFRHTRERQFGDWDRALVKYLDDGLRVTWPLLDVARWRFPDLRGCRLLDFASGFGRITRHFVRHIPPEQITVSDIMADGVAFQQKHFGVRGIVSTDHPSGLRCDDRFDLIFVTSLFTHLPDDLFQAWLRRLLELLTPQGILVFSVHDKSLMSEKRAEEHCFRPRSESAILPAEQYGTAWVTEEYVRRALADIPPAGCRRLPRALNNFQDLYVVSKKPFENDDLPWNGGPDGHIENGLVHGIDVLRCTGWAAENSPWSRMDRVEIWWGGERVAVAKDLEERADVAKVLGERHLRTGFNFSIPLSPERSFTAPFLVVPFNSSGRHTLLHAGSVDGLRLRMLQNELIDPWNPFDAQMSEIQLLRALRDKSRRLEDTLSEVRVSRIWRMRNRLVRLRQLWHSRSRL